ncbi:MAG: hypothetical protein M1274_05035 [Actinobacteria bacterium]|nr:hypothetical protein [Actinomycetota bacterium]
MESPYMTVPALSEAARVQRLSVDVCPVPKASSEIELAVFEAMRRTVRLVRPFQGDEPVKVIIGGIVNEKVREYVGADAWTCDAAEDVKICLSWWPGCCLGPIRFT